MIDRAFETWDDRPISNGEAVHAVYLICKFLETAQRRVKVRTGHLSRTFNGVLAYGEPELAERTIGFLQRGGELHIVIVEEPDLEEGQEIKDHPLLKILCDADIGKGRVRVSQYRGTPHAEVPPYHFIVVDGEAYRLEHDPDNAKAFVELRNTKTAGMLESIFDQEEVYLTDPLLELPMAERATP